jgi:hypothetical protein
VERALDVCRRVVDQINADPVWRARLIDPVELWGLEALTSTEAVIRIVVRAQPGPDAPETSRVLRQRLHKALAEAGIRFGASREITLASGPSAVSISSQRRRTWRCASTTRSPAKSASSFPSGPGTWACTCAG